MGMALPLSLLLVAVAALVLALAYVASWGMGSRPEARRKLWLSVMVVTTVLSVGPLLFFAAGAVDEMTRGASPVKPLGLFAVVVVILVLTYVRFRRERSPAPPDQGAN